MILHDICPNGVFKLLSELNPYKSLGPDAISGHVLKHAAIEVTAMLTHLFQQSLSTSEIPRHCMEISICHSNL